MNKVILTLCAMFALAACETVEGFGEDVQHGGAAIEDAANDAQY